MQDAEAVFILKHLNTAEFDAEGKSVENCLQHFRNRPSGRCLKTPFLGGRPDHSQTHDFFLFREGNSAR